jgi:hypothetical protein
MAVPSLISDVLIAATVEATKLSNPVSPVYHPSNPSSSARRANSPASADELGVVNISIGTDI